MSRRTHIVNTEDEFWSLVDKLSGPRSIFDEQGERHGQIDGELQDAIEATLVPLCGPWEDSGNWFHNTDFFGNGIRGLLFKVDAFPWHALAALQKHLHGDKAAFCISVQLCDSLAPDSTTLGGLAILREDVVVSHSVAGFLKKS